MPFIKKTKIVLKSGKYTLRKILKLDPFKSYDEFIEEWYVEGGEYSLNDSAITMINSGKNILRTIDVPFMIYKDEYDPHDWFGEDDEGLESIAKDDQFEVYYKRWIEYYEKNLSFVIEGDKKKYKQLSEEEKRKHKDSVEEMYYDAIDSLDTLDIEYIYRKIYILESSIKSFIEKLREGVFIEEYNGIGIFWSYNELMAKAYWLDHFSKDTHIVPVLIKAKYDSNIVNWKATIFKHLEAEVDEAEIQLKKNSLIHIIDVNILGKDYPINRDIITLNTEI